MSTFLTPTEENFLWEDHSHSTQEQSHQSKKISSKKARHQSKKTYFFGGKPAKSGGKKSAKKPIPVSYNFEVLKVPVS